ncbi:2,3-bisphosphoglycerate-independent phosphoglycerate mutase, partial [Patescibacteria group bacterium]|nr:2,3-bisphosphoglycerate-independent phosphoglycerate mutase [Patescibacteria group bacterium]
MADILNKIRPVILIILDGWGVAPPSQSNAIAMANLPVFNKLTRLYPSMTIQASGEAVGLSWGEPGNSEVGHLNIGAGAIVWQSFPLINRSIIDGSFFKNQVFIEAIKYAQKNNSNLHLIGLTSNGGVHSSIDHLYALLEIAEQNNFSQVFIHAILDGRDTAQSLGKKFIKDIMAKIKTIGLGQIATISGRFYAMDRDNRWPRIETAYLAMSKGLSEKEFTDPLMAIDQSYQEKIYDEELK